MKPYSIKCQNRVVTTLTNSVRKRGGNHGPSGSMAGAQETEGPNGLMTKFLNLGLSPQKISIEDRKSLKDLEDKAILGGVHKEKVKKLSL